MWKWTRTERQYFYALLNFYGYTRNSSNLNRFYFSNNRNECEKKKHLHTLQWRKRKLKLNWFGWKSTVFVCWLFQDILFRPYEMLCNWIVIEQLLLSMQAAAAQSQIQTTYTNVQRQQMKRTIRMIRNERVVLPIENHERVSSGDSKRRKSKWNKMNYSLWCWTFETIVSFDYIDFFLFPSCSIQLEFQTNVWVWWSSQLQEKNVFMLEKRLIELIFQSTSSITRTKKLTLQLTNNWKRNTLLAVGYVNG